MPSHQYRKIITGRSGKENLSPSKSNTSSNKSKGSTPKKVAKTSKETSNPPLESKKSKQDVGKQPAKPKSLEQAFKSLTPDEFASNLEKFKLLYPGSKLSWLKGVCFSC